LFERIINRGAVTSLLAARIIYSLNWYNVAAIFSLMAFEFNENVAGLGAIVGSFYLGVGLFQIPGGILAARIGPRRVAIYGTAIASLGVILTGFATQFYEITLLRFMVGSGMALVFAPGITLTAKYFRKGAEGLAIGVYNGAYYLGGAIGLFGWAVLGELVGWRPSLIASGILSLLSALALLISLPRDELREEFKLNYSALRTVLTNRWLILISVVLVGVDSGTALTGNFTVLYLEEALKAPVAVAGVIASLALFFGLVASPLSGRVYDRIRDVPKLLFGLGVLLAIGMALASIPAYYSIVLSTALVGFSTSAALTVGFSAARAVNRGEPEYETVAVSLANSIALTAAFWSPLVFSALTVHFGYRIAWLLGSIYTLLLISPILKGKKERR